MNKELTSLTLDEYVQDFQLNENPESLTDIVQDGGFIRDNSITPDMVDNQDKLLEEPGTLLQNGGCPCAGKKYTDYASLQSGGDNASVNTNALFQQFLDENQSLASIQSGGDNVSVNTNALFQQFLDENQSDVLSIQSGGDNTSVNTNELFKQFLDENQSLASLQSGGDNASVNTNELFKTFLGNTSEVDILHSGGNESLQSGGDDSLYSSIDTDLMSTGTIDLFSNFVNKYKFKKQMQTGGNLKKSENRNNTPGKKVLNISEAVKMLNDVYKN